MKKPTDKEAGARKPTDKETGSSTADKVIETVFPEQPSPSPSPPPEE